MHSHAHQHPRTASIESAPATRGRPRPAPDRPCSLQGGPARTRYRFFRVGVIERLELSDQSFDAALSTMMMHHLPDDLKRRGLAEMARTLKPGGRLVVVDFKRPEPRAGRPAGPFRRGRERHRRARGTCSGEDEAGYAPASATARGRYSGALSAYPHRNGGSAPQARANA